MTREVPDKQSNGSMNATEKVRKARERAERAEAELARVTEEAGKSANSDSVRTADDGSATENGEAELRKDTMMAHLLDSLKQGRDIGHYGRLVFAMTARYFMPQENLLAWLTRDPDFDETKAKVLIRQIEEHGYNPPRRERIREWQAEQEFPIFPNPQDPDCGNLYRNLKFPDTVYEHIEKYIRKRKNVVIESSFIRSAHAFPILSDSAMSKLISVSPPY